MAGVCCAQVDDGPCVMYVGEGGSGNYVKMVHNGIEYGDMQVRRHASCALSPCAALHASHMLWCRLAGRQRPGHRVHSRPDVTIAFLRPPALCTARERARA